VGARTYTRTHARTHAHTDARTHARTHAHTHAHTHARTHAHTHAHTQVIGINKGDNMFAVFVPSMRPYAHYKGGLLLSSTSNRLGIAEGIAHMANGQSMMSDADVPQALEVGVMSDTDMAQWVW